MFSSIGESCGISVPMVFKNCFPSWMYCTAQSFIKVGHLYGNLLISNVEKSLIRQEQKTNEISKNIKQNQSKQQKNCKGSHSSESMTSPERLTLLKPLNHRQKRPFVDLTKDDTNESENESTMNCMTWPPASYSQKDKTKTK
jgi:hypothetical protein